MLLETLPFLLAAIVAAVLLLALRSQVRVTAHRAFDPDRLLDTASPEQSARRPRSTRDAHSRRAVKQSALLPGRHAGD